MDVIKRDGRRVEFDHSRIYRAIQKAFDATEGVECNYSFCCRVATLVFNLGVSEITVDEIQTIVEKELLKEYPDVAYNYMDYRRKRDAAREASFTQVLDGIIKLKSNDVTLENGNMNAETPAGMMYKVSSEVAKDYALKNLVSPSFAKAHIEGDIHIHDLDYYITKSFTCVQHPLNKILLQGFSAGHGESRPAKRIETASILGCISMETVQNEMHGGQAIPAFDFYLAPFVRKTFQEELDKLSEILGRSLSYLYDVKLKDYIKKDLQIYNSVRITDKRIVQFCVNKTVDRVHQSMEAFVHNMNTIHSRGGNQVVFSSINYGTDISPEGRCIIREILNVTYRGVGNGKTAIFPIQIWKVKSGVSYLKTDPNYDLYQLACKVAAKRFFPNFLNLDADFNTSDLWRADDPERYLYEVATMGCRTRTFENLFGLKTSVGRGNLSFTSINLPRLGIEVSNKYPKASDAEKINYLISDLLSLEELVAAQLHERFLFQKQAKKKQFPLLMSGIWIGSSVLDDNDSVESVINQGTLAIGFIGLAECLVAILGKHHGESEVSQIYGLSIIKAMKDKAAEMSLKYKHNYSILGTPAEGLSGRFTKLDRARYGIIKGVTDREFYTNSNHVPVYFKCTAKHKAEVECPYHTLTRGGHIFYVEQDGNPEFNPQSIMKVVDMLHKYNGGYASINYNQNTCMNCGYVWNGKDVECPNCHSSNIDTLQRITGYLVGSTKRWNSGKLAELRARCSHKL